ncbi:MAG: TolC family protein [Bdellovibrionaceae bacterium]|nr:TolC family protein [Pseudobdellovibrionaceae bacterium]
MVIGLLFLLVTQNAQASKLSLDQKEVARLVLERSFRAREINLKYEQLLLPLRASESIYDWRLAAETGYEFDRSETLSLIGNENKFERLTSYVQLGKTLSLGTSLNFEYRRTAQKASVPGAASIPGLATLDTLTFSLEQPLWNNSFGISDRAKVRKARLEYESSKVLRANELEDSVLEALRSFWNTYVAQANLQEAINSRERYEQLVKTVRKKSAVGYTSPGELSQVLAEYEGRVQNVKTASQEYLRSLDAFMTLLDLPPETELEFKANKEIPPPPKLSPIHIEELRNSRSQQLRLKAAEENLTASRWGNSPNLSLILRAGQSGLDDTGEAAYSELLSGRNPRYYAGLKFQYAFGAGAANEDLVNKRLARDAEQNRLARLNREERDRLEAAERRVATTYALALSSKTQRDLREKAMQELNRSFNQGRTDISVLIEAMNRYFATEIQYIRAVGDYQIALNEWAAQRDELIPSAKEEK